MKRLQQQAAMITIGCIAFGTLLTCASGGSLGFRYRPKPAAAELRESARALQSVVPDPVWQASLRSFAKDFVDEIVVARSGDVLVAVRGGPYVMLDAATGEELWRYRRLSSASSSWTVIETEPVVLTMRRASASSTLIALDAATGKPRWTDEGAADRAIAMAADSASILVADSRTGGVDIRKLELGSGRASWSVRFEEPGQAAPSLMLTGNLAIVVATNGYGVSMTDGAVLWKVDAVGPVPEASFPVWAGDRLVVPRADGALTAVDSEGRTPWTLALGEQPRAILSIRNRLFVQTRDQESRLDRIVAVAAKSGRERWELQLTGRLMSHLVEHDGKLAFTQFDPNAFTNTLQIVGSKRGSRRRAVRLSDCGAHRLPDRLVVAAGNLVLVQESKVSAYDLKTGNRRWQIQPEGARTFAWMRSELDSYVRSFEAFEAAMEGEEARAQRGITLHSFDESIHAATSSARAYQESVYLLTAPTLGSGSRASSGERELARLERTNAIVHSMSQATIDQAFSRLDAQANYTFAAMDAMIQFHNAAARAHNLKRMGKLRSMILAVRGSIRTSLATHARLLQGRYYVRPIVHRGAFSASRVKEKEPWWGVLVVDIQTGRWARAITSASPGIGSDYLHERFEEMENQLPIVSLDGTRLYSRGTGLRTSLWKMRDSSEGIVHASILATRWDGLDFQEPEAYRAPSAFGYIDKTGRFVIPPTFDTAQSFSEGRAAVSCSKLVGYIDHAGEFVVAPHLASGKSYREGLAVARRFDDRWQYFDLSGEPAWGGRTFDWVDSFSGGLAAFKVGERRGYIDRSGKVHIPAMFFDTYAFSAGLAAVRRTDDWEFEFIDTSGRTVVPAGRAYPGGNLSEYFNMGDWGFSDSVVVTKGENGYGYVNRSGRAVPAGWFYEVLPFSEGLGAVETREPSGNHRGKFIDASGKTALPGRYGRVQAFSEGLAAVQRYPFGSWGYVDHSGELVVDQVFYAAGPFSEGLAAVCLDSYDLSMRFGLVDPLGGSVFGYIDRSGEFVIPPQFRKAGRFSGGVAAVIPLELPLEPAPQSSTATPQ